MKTTPRLHADLIKAWADGATIQIGIPHQSGRQELEWVDVAGLPVWDNKFQLRIKPREFPQSRISGSQLQDIYVESTKGHGAGFFRMGLEAVANEAIKQYILDEEKKAVS